MKHKKQSVPNWVSLPIDGETVDVLKVWELNDPAHAWPQVAIIRASTANAKKLLEDNTTLRQFLNANGIFSPAVKVIGHRASLPSAAQPCAPPGWDFIVIHGRASTANAVLAPCLE